jgi:D-amino-acid dehydrogenase
VLAMEPSLREEIVGGIHHPLDARLRPDRYVAELARHVRALGGIIEEDTKARRFVTGKGRIDAVRTPRGLFTADRVVLALGAWSAPIAAHLGLHVPVQPGKGYSITYSRPASCPRTPMILHEVSVCVTAWESGFRLGSTMEFSGYDRRLNEARLAALERGAALYLRDPTGPEVRERWWGWRPMSVDEIPVIGPSTRWSNLMLATGHGMMGMSMSAATGELIASLCAGPAPTLDPTPYAPARFRL